ncbi:MULTISPECIES: nitrate- and nitrite sensing domain-containing protein [Streptomyces]|uniref:histidine kinase n=1 Tax=Streptomyces edwardsiae TaxID=3075527 RepID=A0ABU2PVK4_9ACTN|nr:nitrate- and nitrite sensing domain-containing protein [Streptomyces sp. DSM 41636]MDT0396204.1 nitrate- and nitrite sensing domain-containing protein [Streptomyces sp. DSM 41636]
MSPRTGARRRLGSIRLSLFLLALVPSVTLAGMWGLTTIQMFSEGLQLRSQTELSRSTGAMGTHATLALQQERRLTAAWLAEPRTSRTALEAQRERTDEAVAKLVGQADAIADAPARISDRMYGVLGSVGSLEYYRDQVDQPSDITAEQALDQYTSIIDDQIHAFQELSQVDDGDLTSQAGPLVSLEHAAELISEEDARLTLAWPAGRLDTQGWSDFAKLVHTRRWLVEDQIVPSLRGETKTQTERILQSAEWRALEAVEDQILATPPTGEKRRVDLPDLRERWQEAMDRVSPQYATMIRQQTDALLTRSADEARSLLVTAASLSAAGLLALLLCVGLSWRITRSLSRRLRGLRVATLGLAEERLPDVVARLERGEKVDAESATTPLDYGHDELGQVAQAFNTAQRTAVHTAVELADTRRGFQKVILGIARQSQNLVNLQLSKLDALERRHTDPEVLKGLYELDSTASQLRRYEENLVIVSGERPGRSWSEPVALIDIMRSAVGEVAEYQRVELHTEEEVSVAPPAVADVIHLLAELIDNATVYSPAPSPVGVRAAMVAKGLVVEIEDRGLGMSDDDYASLNGQLAKAPQFDVVALADDLRLGMFVISQLAHRHGIGVTLRPSPYGGTTAIVLIPHEIVVRDAASGGARGETGADRADVNGRVDDAHREKVTAGAAASRPAAAVRTAPAPAAAPEPAPRKDGLIPLPRRVPQTSLAAELREDSAPDADDDVADFTAEHAASSLAGFQLGTSQARDDDTDDADGTAAPAHVPAAPDELPTPPADR